MFPISECGMPGEKRRRLSLSMHDYYLPLDAALLRRPAAIVRQRGHVLDGLDRQPRRLQCGDRRLTAGSGAFHPYLDLLDSEFRRLIGASLGCALGRERSALAAPLEPDGPRRSKAKRIAVGIGNSWHGVIECRLDMGDSPANITPGLALLALGHCSKSPTW